MLMYNIGTMISKSHCHVCYQMIVADIDLCCYSEPKIANIVTMIEPENLPVMIGKGAGLVFGWHAGVDVSFHNIFYRKDGIQRLQGISGYFRSGSTVAVLGAPDAGITTFFDVLCKRHHGGHSTGELLINGQPPDRSFERLVGYITKDDMNLPVLTVRETLMFSCQLRTGLPESACRLRVEIIMKILNLRGCADTIVGDGAIRGISGGERRRVSIGCEMVAGHPIIIADLPTNGLDSATAYDIMRTVKHANKGGRTFVCSLSQPSPDLLNVINFFCHPFLFPILTI
jgi:ABC-type multidrug transport system ATPase subunit